MTAWDAIPEETPARRGRRLAAGLGSTAVLVLVPALAFWLFGPATAESWRGSAEASAPREAAALPRVLVFEVPSWAAYQARQRAEPPAAPADPIAARLTSWTHWTGHRVVFYR
jgi:hypothetical protein